MRFAASALVDRLARSRRATSSIQIGWMRCLPLPMIGVTGRDPREPPEGRQDPAVPGEDEARPEDHVLEPRAADRLLLSHFAW